MSSLISVMDRISALGKLPIVVDSVTQMDAEMAFTSRLHDLVVYSKRGTDKPLILWQLIDQRAGDKSADADEDDSQRKESQTMEWLYEF
eukprot:gene23932-42400_t